MSEQLTRREQNRARYDWINRGPTLPVECPALTRPEAARAVRKLARHFVPANKRYKVDGQREVDVRRVWLAKKPTRRFDKGWRRLIHDVSHDIFDAIYPHKRAHDPLHARYEADVLTYVVEHGWLEGKLRPQTRAPKPPPSEYETRSAALDKCNASIRRWESKAKRAANALKKLRRQQARLSKKLTETHAEEVDTLLLKM